MSLKDIFKSLGRDPRLHIVVGTVTEVDIDKLTIDVQPADGGAPIEDVRLRASVDGQSTGLILIPAIGSSVVIGCIDGDDTQPAVLLCSEIEKASITIDGVVLEVSPSGISLGKSGGSTFKAVKGDPLQQQLNVLKARVDAIYQALLASPVVPGDGGATFKAAIVAAIATTMPADFGQILSNKITLE